VAILFQSNLIGKITGQLLPGEKDPTRRVRAWKPTTALVENAREKLEAEGKPAFIIADHYGMTGLYSFYLPQAKAALPSEPLVYCADSDEPVNQFYFWPEYNGIIVAVFPPAALYFPPRRWELLARLNPLS
jgi:hypothetical protein